MTTNFVGNYDESEHRLMARVSVDDAAEADRFLTMLMESSRASRIYRRNAVYSTLDV